MKKAFFIAVLTLLGTAVQAQSGTGFGVKAGLSYNQNGDLGAAIGNASTDVSKGAKGKAGFHLGVWGKLDLPKIYLRPELLYTKTRSAYKVNNKSLDYDIQRLDLPVLLGYKFIGPLHVFVGPAFQYILDNDLEDINVKDVENQFTVGFNLGAGLNLGPLGLDIRYERGFSKNQAKFIGDIAGTDISGRVDARPSQIILSASFKLY